MSVVYKHEELLLRLHPAGAHNLDQGTLARAELAAWGAGLDAVWAQRELLEAEILPDDQMVTLLVRWEAIYDLHRTSLSTEARKARVLAARRRQPDLRPATLIENLETATGLEIAVEEPFAFFYDTTGSLLDTYGDILDGAYLFFVTLDEVAAEAASVTRTELQQLINRLKPAHTAGLVLGDDFRYEDEFSSVDIDVYGV